VSLLLEKIKEKLGLKERLPPPRRVIHEGSSYHLKEIYDQVNSRYFEGRLSLQITWYGQLKRRKRRRRHVVFGQYVDALKLVKIHRRLDDPSYPDFFVSFIVYHEMLHHVVPGYMDARGYYRCHGPEFKRREREFEHYQKALVWEKQNHAKIFS